MSVPLDRSFKIQIIFGELAFDKHSTPKIIGLVLIHSLVTEFGSKGPRCMSGVYIPLAFICLVKLPGRGITTRITHEGGNEQNTGWSYSLRSSILLGFINVAVEGI